MPSIGKIKNINFKVNCIRESYLYRDMQMKLIYTEKGTWFPAPCNGCEMMDGHDECYECVSSLNSMFFENPNLDISTPLYPQKKR